MIRRISHNQKGHKDDGRMMEKEVAVLLEPELWHHIHPASYQGPWSKLRSDLV